MEQPIRLIREGTKRHDMHDMHDIYDIGQTSQLGTKGTIARNAQGTICTIGTIGTINGTFRVTSGTLGTRTIGTESASQVKIFRGKCK